MNALAQAVSTLPEIWQFLIQGGSIVVASVIISVIFEKFDWWHKLDSMVKIVIQVGLASIFGILATFMLNNPEVLAGAEAYILVVINVILGIGSNQGWFAARKKIINQ